MPPLTKREKEFEEQKKLILEWGSLYRDIKADVANLRTKEDKKKAGELRKTVRKLKHKLKKIIYQYSIKGQGTALYKKISGLLEILGKIERGKRTDVKHIAVMVDDFKEILGVIEEKKKIVKDIRRGRHVAVARLTFIVTNILVALGVQQLEAKDISKEAFNEFQQRQVIVQYENGTNIAKLKKQVKTLQKERRREEKGKALAGDTPKDELVLDGIKIEGKPLFVKNTTDALEGVKRDSPIEYKLIKIAMAIIKQDWRVTGISSKDRDLIVGPKDWRAVQKWYESVLVHEAYHYFLNHYYKEKLTPAEKEALANMLQARYLERVGASKVMIKNFYRDLRKKAEKDGVKPDSKVLNKNFVDSFRLGHYI